MNLAVRKAGRHEAILRIVGRAVVRTQGEMKRLLAAEGHAVDQATLSRDIRELGLVKVAGQDGEGTHYSRVGAPAGSATEDAVAVVARFVKSVDWAGNLVVARTAPGSANTLGIAFDRLAWTDVVGTVAGDDTLLLVVRTESKARKVVERIRTVANL